MQLTTSPCVSLIGRLGKPKITQSLMTSVNSTCNVTLTCSVDTEEKNVTYSWSPQGKGNVLQIFRGPESQELNYTCTAWNPVSNSSDSISTQHLCSGELLPPSLPVSPRNHAEGSRSWSPGKCASAALNLVPKGISSQQTCWPCSCLKKQNHSLISLMWYFWAAHSRFLAAEAF